MICSVTNTFAYKQVNKSLILFANVNSYIKYKWVYEEDKIRFHFFDNRLASIIIIGCNNWSKDSLQSYLTALTWISSIYTTRKRADNKIMARLHVGLANCIKTEHILSFTYIQNTTQSYDNDAKCAYGRAKSYKIHELITQAHTRWTISAHCST